MTAKEVKSQPGASREGLGSGRTRLASNLEAEEFRKFPAKWGELNICCFPDQLSASASSSWCLPCPIQKVPERMWLLESVSSWGSLQNDGLGASSDAKRKAGCSQGYLLLCSGNPSLVYPLSVLQHRKQVGEGWGGEGVAPQGSPEHPATASANLIFFPKPPIEMETKEELPTSVPEKTHTPRINNSAGEKRVPIERRDVLKMQAEALGSVVTTEVRKYGPGLGSIYK